MEQIHTGSAALALLAIWDTDMSPSRTRKTGLPFIANSSCAMWHERPQPTIPASTDRDNTSRGPRCAVAMQRCSDTSAVDAVASRAAVQSNMPASGEDGFGESEKGMGEGVAQVAAGIVDRAASRVDANAGSMWCERAEAAVAHERTAAKSMAAVSVCRMAQESCSAALFQARIRLRRVLAASSPFGQPLGARGFAILVQNLLSSRGRLQCGSGPLPSFLIQARN
jgi:hypothetical protein